MGKAYKHTRNEWRTRSRYVPSRIAKPGSALSKILSKITNQKLHELEQDLKGSRDLGVKTTLETSGEDVKTHSKWVGKI